MATSATGELLCAATLANLEGAHKIPFREPRLLDLEVLDSRTRVMEAKIGIPSPPPVEDVTWLGLIWRVWRLRDKTYMQTMLCEDSPTLRTMTLHLSHISSKTVRDAVDSISPGFQFQPGLQYPMWPEDGTEDEQMAFALQKLAHLAGWWGQKFDVSSVTPIDIYINALRLALRKESSPPLGPRISPIRPRSIPYFRTCHPRGRSRQPEKQRRSSSSDASDTDSEPHGSRKRSLFGSGWLSKLLFWRKKQSSVAKHYASSCSSSFRSDP